MSKRIRSLRCPTCKQQVTSKSPDFPFCSDRCRLIDLGKWASGAYVISSPLEDASETALEDRAGGDAGGTESNE